MKFIRLKAATGKVEVPEGMSAVDAVLMGADGNAVNPGSAPAADSITTAMLQDGSVTDDKVAQDAIGEGNIKGSAVTTAKIKDRAVTAAKLASGVLPVNATKAKAGLVKQAATVADCAATDVEGCKTSINKIIKTLKDAGIMSAS